MLSVFLITFLVPLVINVVLLLVAFSFKTDKFTDIAYALSFLGVDIAYLIHYPLKGLYDILGILLSSLWALRIGSFLLYRILKRGKDKRFDGIREKFLKFSVFWIGQALTVFLLMLPSGFAFTKHHHAHVIAYVGVAIWLIGLVVEALSDIEKFMFLSKNKEKHLWIDEGLWHYSRHPNYFGEISVWLGIYIYAFVSISWTYRIVGLVSPIFITFLLLRVSGVPMLEASADKKWGDNPKYQEYKKSTSLIIPLPKKTS